MKISTYTTYVSVLARLLYELNKKTTFEKKNRIQDEVVDKQVKYLRGSTFTFRLSFLERNPPTIQELHQAFDDLLFDLKDT